MDAPPNGPDQGRDSSSGAAPQPSMVSVPEQPVWRYERIVRYLSSENAPEEDALNELGEDGWELAATMAVPPRVFVYLKRLEG